MRGFSEALKLLARTQDRRPATPCAGLDQLFRRLARASGPADASETELAIWAAWMHHPHDSAARTLELASDDIAGRPFDIAETRLSILIRRVPDFPEAWHKRAVLYYLTGDDDACVADLFRALQLEPRHFSAMLHFAELLLEQGRNDDARFASAMALCWHPHLQRARDILAPG